MNEPGPKRFPRLRKWVWRATKTIGLMVLLLAVTLLAGLIPVNNDFTPTEQGIEIHVISNAVHADVIAPIRNSIIDWTTEFPNEMFSDDISKEPHVAFGWGDRGFFIETPTWADLKLSTAANALLLPSECCLRVFYTNVDYYSERKSVSISDEQYRDLVEYIRSSFLLTETNDIQQIPNAAYSGSDAFFRAKGRYHFLNTCNAWVGRGLKSAGVRTGWLTPLPGGPTIYFD